jgi:hypothetical protein
MEEKAQSQQYLTPWKEDVLIKYYYKCLTLDSQYE